MTTKNKVPEPLEGLKFIDVHSHLPFPRSKNKLPNNTLQAKTYFEQGGKFLISSTIDMNTLNATLDFIEETKFEKYGFTCGWAPQTVTYTPKKKYKKEWEKWTNFVKNKHDKFLAIGEIGLDFHHAKSLEKRKEQVSELTKVFELTEDLNKPYVLHVRNPAKHEFDKNHPKHRFNAIDGATKEIIGILEDFKINPEDIMFHCFSGPQEYGFTLAKQGYSLSVPSSAYGNNRWRENTKDSPIESLMTETDTPYQHPYKRGPVNMPVNVKYSIAAISYSHDIPQEDVSEITTQNAVKFFDIEI